MIKQFLKILKLIYSLYLQAIFFISGFVILNIACYRINVEAGLFTTAATLILFGIILNHDQERR
jgi:hypothetical protein